MLQRCSVYSTQSVNTGAVLAANKSAWSVVQVAVKTECFLATQLVQSAAGKSGVCVPESAGSAIFRATVQPRSLSLAPAAAASVLQNGISTATRTRSTCFVRELRHPHLPQQKARQHAPRARVAPLPPEQGRCALYRGLAAGARIVRAPGLPPAPRMRARAGKWLPARVQFFWRAARPPSGSALQPARGHIHLAQRSTVAVVASARRTPQSTPVRYTCASINCLRVRFLSRIWIAK